MDKKNTQLTDFQKDLLKQEIELIDKTIARIDNILLTMKSTTVLIWGGSLYLIAEHLTEYKQSQLILLTAVIPLLFGYLDIIWKQQLLKASYREERISDFVNGIMSEENFKFLDPIGAGYKSERCSLKADFEKKTSWKRAIGYKEKGIFYLLLFMISVAFGIMAM